MCGDRPSFVRVAVALAGCSLLPACGGHAVEGATNAETTATGSDGKQADTGSQTGGGGSRTEGSGGSAAIGNDTGHREAARERAERFVNDFGVPCRHERVTFLEHGDVSAYPTRVLQTRGRPAPDVECALNEGLEADPPCWARFACDTAWWDAQDWSQWSPDATVVEIIGPRAERINLALTTYRSFPLPDGTKLGYTSFYENPPPEPAPPGCHDCGYFWYLDATPDGVALVLGPPLAGDLEGGLAFTELNLCLLE